jgi:hypothetical protein
MLLERSGSGPRIYLPEGTYALFAHTDWSYLRGNSRAAVRDRGNDFPEGFSPPCPGGKDFCCIDAHHGRPRSVPCDREASAEQHRWRDSNLLSHRNGMADRQEKRRGNQSFRLGCAPDSVGARCSHVDEWSKSRAERSEFTRRSSRWNELLHGFRDAAGGCWGRSHAATRRCFWSQAHRAASLAHVLWAVHRSRVFFHGTLEPSLEIAFNRGARATPVPGSIQHDVVFNSHHTPTGSADFLASPSALPKCVQGVDTTRIR